MVRNAVGEAEALLIRVRADAWEVSKGHVEPGESEIEAAVRELREETALESPVVIGPAIGAIEYAFEREGTEIRKRVTYFLATVPGDRPLRLGKLPRRTRELRWVKHHELAELPLVSDDLRRILNEALDLAIREASRL